MGGNGKAEDEVKGGLRRDGEEMATGTKYKGLAVTHSSHVIKRPNLGKFISVSFTEHISVHGIPFLWQSKNCRV